MIEVKNVGNRTFLLGRCEFPPGHTIFVSAGEYANLVSMFPTELLLVREVLEEPQLKVVAPPPSNKVALFPPSKGQKKR